MSGTLSRVRSRPGGRMRISLTSGLTIGGKPIHDRRDARIIRASRARRRVSRRMQQSFLIVLGAEGHGQEQPFPQPLTSRVPLRSNQLRVILREVVA